MTDLAPSLPSHCFQWHPDARAFAADAEVFPSPRPDHPRVIAPHPPKSALQNIAAALAANTPFCVTDQAVHDMAALGPTQFATLTGGTSGPPKVIQRSQASWIASFYANAAQFAYEQSDSIAVLGGLGHSLTLYGLLEGLHLGRDVHVLTSLAPAVQATQIHTHRCSIIYATPTQLRVLPPSTQLPDVRLILCGGGALNRTTRQHIATLCPNAALHVFYGAAETSFVTLGGPDTPQGSVGRAYPNVRIDIREPDVAGIGTVWINSPYLSEGYLQGHSPHTQRDGHWITVGEQGRLDAHGNLFLEGRAGRAVTIADDTIHLDALEAQLADMPDMPHFVLMPRADKLRGHHLVAVIEGDAQPALASKINSYCTTNGLHPPRDITFLEQLPLLPSGKPDLHRIASQTGTSA
ncbi:MAG: AMP-binding protein [Sulfitobacter sp.]